MKVSDIRPDDLALGMIEAQQRDIKMLMAWSPNFVDINCPSCSSESRILAYEYNGLHYQRCVACKMQYVSPRPTQSQLEDFYSVSENYAYWAKYIYPASESVRREKIFAPRAKLVADISKKNSIFGGELIEVGPGYGVFLEEIAKRGVFDKVSGIEPSPELATICRRKGFSITNRPYEKVPTNQNATAIVSFEVIEHLFDPLSFVIWAYAALAKGGMLLLTCPNIEGLDTLMLGREATAVDHQHLNYFSPKTLSLLLQRAGFQQIQIQTPGELDVDLLRRARSEGKINDDRLGPFLSKIIHEASPIQDRLFQEFLQAAKLSSNMMSLAIKD